MLITRCSLPLLERFNTPDSHCLTDVNNRRLSFDVANYLRDRFAILFNSSGLDVLGRTNKYPYASASVVNFGVDNLAGTTMSGIDTLRLARRIRLSILRFEPRINQQGLVVRFSQIDHRSGTSLNFIIEGEVDYRHERFAFSLNSRWNTDSGEVQVTPFYMGAVYG